LRFRERLELFGSEKGRGSFKSSDSGEGPAGSTLSLVFNSIDGSLLSPVNRVRKSDSVKFGNIGRVLSLGLESFEHSGEFRGSKVHEFVEIHFVSSVFFLLVFFNFVVVLVENSESVFGFNFTSISLLVFFFPVLP